ncbi:MAG TPA: protein translocase subunit SecF, partial [Longimicrobiaceae bacterium]|nr:protein translocase subunit SecF [Longimicrobiaceae bacterium]
AYIISAALLVFGIGAMFVNHFTTRSGAWLNYGIDFTGGTIVQVDFNQPTTVEEIRSAVAAAGGTGWEITRFGAEDEFIVRMPGFEGEVGWDPSQRVEEILSPRYGEGAFNLVRTEAVGPKIGGELQERALIAILVSFLATLIYLAFRFEWRFGVAAVIATAHDILVTLGFLALFRTEISVGTIAAFLTIVGYSLNDTIVVFDRVRENLANPRRGISLKETLNRSINETLPRTVLTSGTTLVTLFALYLFGGTVIRDFALVLILGIAIGTFSSIFVATPALYAIQQRWPRAEKKGAARGAPATRDRVRTAV